jgi:hypothetical protein
MPRGLAIDYGDAEVHLPTLGLFCILSSGALGIPQQGHALRSFGRTVRNVFRNVDAGALGEDLVTKLYLALQDVPHLSIGVAVDRYIRFRTPVPDHDVRAFATLMLNQELRHAVTGLHPFNVSLINRLHLTAHEFLLSSFFVAW